MGVKLYPPVVENTLPACYRNERGMVVITIPFTMNRSVSAAEVGGFELKIKTIQTGSYLYTFKTVNPNDFSVSDNECSVTFEVYDKDSLLKIGQFYKIQLAYISVDAETKSAYERRFNLGDISLSEYEDLIMKDSIVGFYSTASTIKYTTKPLIYINDFDANRLNAYTHNFIGYYDQTNGDITEKLYSYQFNIYNKNNKIVYTSNEQIHNSANDDENFGLAFDNYSLFVDLEYNVIYYIQYTITTINNLVLSSPKYRITQRETIDPEIHATLNAALNFDNGYVSLTLIPESEGILDTGSFVICRADEDSNFTHWEELFKFKLYKERPKGLIYKDFTFAQGKKYQYSLQQYNDYDLYSKRILSNIIVGDFEDGFIYDGSRQLKVKFNMKISKLTNNILEAKQETIGSQYPYFFRNGTVNYFEFPISGLISYRMDEEHLFIDKEKLNLFDPFSRTETDSLQQNFYDSSGEEIYRERVFKTEVLKWLNDGKPKLIRTPTEGNFVVRLMKISLSPEDKLGRMIHTFSCTAYEVAKYNSDSLRALQILKPSEREILIPQWKTINLANYNVTSIITIDIPQDASLMSLHFDNMGAGDTVLLTMKDRTQQSIQIGETGSYYLDNLELPLRTIKFTPRYLKTQINEEDFERNSGSYYVLLDGEYKQVKFNEDKYSEWVDYYILSNAELSGLITYGYILKKDNSFAHIKTVQYNDSTFKQFIGEHDILREIQSINTITKDIKKELTDISYIRVVKRPIDRIISEYIDPKTLKDNGEFYFGTVNKDGEHRAERTPKIELIYPLGLRAYEPQTYYVWHNNGYVKETDPAGEWSADKIYYLKGRYKKTPYPVGQVAYTPNHFYIKNGDTFDLDPDTSWREGRVYYEQHRTLKGKIFYSEVKYVTHKDYVFEDNKFYRKACTLKVNGSNVTYYTLARKFDPTFYDNKLYYYLDESVNEYQNAYVTINSNYVYSPYYYYVHVVNNGDIDLDFKKDEYILSSELEFNVHNIKIVPQNGDEIEYETTTDHEGRVFKQLKYYKMKTILPHILHQVGTHWDKVKATIRPGYDADLYNFNPVKYKDLYNNGIDYSLDEYAPYITINGEQISVEDNIIFTLDDLSRFGEITELKSGNGVYVDIIYQTKEYNYIIEDSISAKENYLLMIESYKTALNNLTLSEDHPNYVNLDDMGHVQYQSYYNNTRQKSISSAYNMLVTTIAASMNGGESE